jgi:hypothetical protein
MGPLLEDGLNILPEYCLAPHIRNNFLIKILMNCVQRKPLQMLIVDILKM